MCTGRWTNSVRHRNQQNTSAAAIFPTPYEGIRFSYPKQGFKLRHEKGTNTAVVMWLLSESVQFNGARISDSLRSLL